MSGPKFCSLQSVDNLTITTNTAFQWGLSRTMLFTESTKFALTCQLLNPSNTAPVHSLQSNSLFHGLTPPYSIGSSTDTCLDQARVCGFTSTFRVTEIHTTIRSSMASLSGWAWMAATLPGPVAALVNQQTNNHRVRGSSGNRPSFYSNR